MGPGKQFFGVVSLAGVALSAPFGLTLPNLSLPGITVPPSTRTIPGLTIPGTSLPTSVSIPSLGGSLNGGAGVGANLPGLGAGVGAGLGVGASFKGATITIPGGLVITIPPFPAPTLPSTISVPSITLPTSIPGLGGSLTFPTLSIPTITSLPVSLPGPNKGLTPTLPTTLATVTTPGIGPNPTTIVPSVTLPGGNGGASPTGTSAGGSITINTSVLQNLFTQFNSLVTLLQSTFTSLLGTSGSSGNLNLGAGTGLNLGTGNGLNLGAGLNLTTGVNNLLNGSGKVGLNL